MTIRKTTFEGVPLATITTGNQNSAGTSGDALTIVKGGTATIVGTSTAGKVLTGSKSVQINAVAGGDTAYGYWDDGGVAQAGLRAQFRMDAAPGADTSILQIRRASSTTAALVQIKGSTNKLEVYGASGTFLYATPSALTFPGVYTIDVAAQPGTGAGDGKVTFAVYDANGALTAGMSSAYASTTVNAGTGNIVRFVVGLISGTTVWETVIDEVKQTDTYALVGPMGANDARPLSVAAAGSWTAVGAANIALATADNDNLTYMQSADNPSGDLCKLTIQPVAEGAISVPFTYCVSASSPARSLTVALYMGATKIAEKIITNITSTSWINDSIVLTPTEYGNFTDRSAPQLWFTAS